MEVVAVIPNQLTRIKFIGGDRVILLAGFGYEGSINVGIEGRKID
ncbi:hypothetical protein [Cupriavidus necator]